MDLAGVIPPMVTPVAGRTGDVDRDVARSFSKFLVDGGVHGLFPCGSIGEFSSLTRDQRSAMVEAVVESASGVPVLAGCGGTCLGDVCDLVADAADAGADAAVVVTPYYLQTNQDGLLEFYRTVADRSPLDVVLYNIPQLTDHRLAPETVVTLADHPDVVGIKDSSGDMAYHFDLVTRTPDSFSVMQGSSELAVTSLDAGADGLVVGPSNVFPAQHADLYDSYVAGDRERAVELVNSVTTPVVSATRDLPTAAALKYLLRRAGHDVNEPLVPLPLLSASEKRRLDDCYGRITDAIEASDSAIRG